jgi:hypothetical protein
MQWVSLDGHAHVHPTSHRLWKLYGFSEIFRAFR